MPVSYGSARSEAARPDRVLGTLRNPAIGLVDDHPKHRADRLAPELDVENLQPVALRDACRDFTQPLKPFSLCRKRP